MKRTEREIASIAEDVLRSHAMWKMPVNPFDIAGVEEIELAPGDYSPAFDGRIKYLSEVDTYSLAYRIAGGERTEGRVRFTIGHELGHYFLHRDYLRSGKSHGSKADFRSNDVMEQEADEFSAALLMPLELFRKKVSEFRQHVCVLSELCELSARLGTSLTSTIRRYCTADIEAAGALFSRDGIVRWACWSEDMTRQHMGFYPFGERLPNGSVTKRYLEDEGVPKKTEGEVEPEVWFEKPWYRGKLWEETMELGNTGIVVTYLTTI